MDPRDDEFSYPSTGRALTVVIEKGAGINNPTEQGDHSVGFSILTGNEADNAGLVDSDGNAIERNVARSDDRRQDQYL